MLKNKIITTTIGASLFGLTLISQPAQASNINLISTQDTPTAPVGWDDLGWVIEGRAGSIGSWEAAIEDETYTITKTNNKNNEIDNNWNNGVNVNWLLEWDGKEVKFTFGGKSKSYQANSNLFLDGFYLWTRATTTPDKVAQGTQMLVEVTKVKEVGATDFTTVAGITSSAIAPNTAYDTNITKNWFASDKPLTALQGIARMSWAAGAPNPNQKNAQSRVGFKIGGFDKEDPTAVPEPGAIFGLLAVGLGLASKKIKNS